MMKAFFLRFLIVTAIVLGTYLLGAHHVVKWSYIAAFWGLVYTGFYVFHKYYKEDWEDQKGRMKRIVIAVCILPFVGLIFTVGTAFYYGPQTVFVTQVNDISTKGMDAKVLHPFGRGFGWTQPDLPLDLKVVSDTEVQITKEDGTKQRQLISDMFPNAETSRIINNQHAFWWKFDSSGVSEDLSDRKTKAMPAIIFMYGYYMPLPKIAKKWFCPQFTNNVDGVEVKSTPNCEWAQYNVITVHDGGPYRIIYVTLTYLLGLVLLVVLFKYLFRQAKAKAEELTDDLRDRTGL
jgi:hypothetical protein